jgi:membrane protease YdiL (CAAX protease family)
LLLGFISIKVPIALFGNIIKTVFEEYGVIYGSLGYVCLHNIIAILMFLLVWTFSRKIEKSHLRRYAVFVGEKSIKLFCFGATITLCLGVIASLLYILSNRPNYKLLHNDSGIIITILMLSLFGTLLQAIYEELWFRSIVLIKLSHLVGRFETALILGGGFGLLHFLNPNYSLLAIVSAASAGVMLCYSVFITQSIWMAVGLHFGWNAVTSGLIYNRDLFKVTNSDGVTINAFIGAEATIAGCILPLMATVLIVLIPKIFTPEKLIDTPQRECKPES